MPEQNDMDISKAVLQLRSLTAARIMLGRTGVCMPLEEQMKLKLAHAKARDSIYAPWDAQAMAAKLHHLLPVCILHSKAGNRQAYLLQPSLGRQLDDASRSMVEEVSEAGEICIVIGDGLSPVAVDNYALPFIELLLSALRGHSFTPLSLVQQARVAIGDEIGHLMKARMVIMLIGERPGLSSFDSMGLYLTYGPRPGLTDAQRNCISNIRTGGLDVNDAVAKTCFLVKESLRLQISGVPLKDNTNPGLLI